jgi:hypothetical protein
MAVSWIGFPMRVLDEGRPTLLYNGYGANLARLYKA